MKKLGAALVTAAATILSVQAHAKKCSEYEHQVYDVAKAVAAFRQSDQFVNEYGWSAAGPFNKWLQKVQALQDDKEKALELMGTHNFTPMDIYSVADEYRTAGHLDSFYKALDRSIRSLKCRPK